MDGLCGALAVLLIALKLVGWVAWPWWWVLAPLWAPAVVVVTVLLGVVVSLTTKRFTPTTTALVIAGFGSGFTGTAVGVGGPPIALTYQHSEPVTMRATISFFFSVGSVMTAIALAAAGELGWRQLELVALLLPSILLGLWTARRYRYRLVGSAVRPIVLGLSAFSAIALLIRTVV